MVAFEVVVDVDDILMDSNNLGHDSVRSQYDPNSSFIGTSVDDNFSNEWRVSEHEFKQNLRILELERTEDDEKGPFKSLKKLVERVFLGPDYSHIDPKYYGVEPENEGAAFVTDTRRPSYAAVTFSSRHSAIVARQCLADGKATNNWEPVDDIPIYPLADAPPLSLFPMGIMYVILLWYQFAPRIFRLY